MNTPETILSFAYAADPEYVIVDRSTLERYATCPAQARFVDTKSVLNASMIADAGTAVHEAFRMAIDEYLSNPEASPHDVAETVLSGLRSARPDIQPEALKGGRFSAWAWARMLTRIHPSNVLRYDGGEGERSGQLAHDIPLGDLTLRLTGEVDLLVATESPEVVRVIDYKSGWKRYGISDVADSFQFQFYAYLVLHNYPEVQAVEFKVWNTRNNDLSYPVLFARERLGEIETRILSSAGQWYLHRNSSPEDAPVWPAVEKCSICPAAALCYACKHVGEIASDPGAYIDRMVAVKAKLDAMASFASAYVDQHGEIVSQSGAAFGTGKPKANRKPVKALYSIKGEANADQGEQRE